MASAPVTAAIRGATVVMLAGTLAACHFGSGGGSPRSGDTPPASTVPSGTVSTTPSIDLAAQYPGQVGVHFASDASASSKTVDCATGVDFDIVVSTDGQPVSWKAGSSDNVNNFIGNPIGGIDVSPGSGTLPGGGTTTVHVSGAPTSPIDSFWIGATDVRGSGATLEVDCAH